MNYKCLSTNCHAQLQQASYKRRYKKGNKENIVGSVEPLTSNPQTASLLSWLPPCFQNYL